MGSLSPYFSADFGIDNAQRLVTPEAANGTCNLTQVHILHRHGSRYPTSGSPTEKVAELLRTHKRGKDGLWFDGPLAFLNNYEYRVGSELLVPLGRAQLYNSGVKAATDYGRLAAEDLKADRPLFLRAGSQQRIVDSAIAWADGFWGNSWLNKTNLEIQIEERGFNTTLAPNFACSAAVDAFQVQNWVDQYLSNTTMRLQEHVHGAQLTPALVYGMQQLCSYDTVAFGHSDFCGLFTEQDWRGYEFAWDQAFYNNHGPGSPVGPAMGLGWVNEVCLDRLLLTKLVARMTRMGWESLTQTSENATLNSNPALFPLDRAIYADFTHDSVLTSVLATLQLKEFGIAPSLSDERRAFRSSLIVPFAARLVVEVWRCPTSPLVKRRVPVPLGPERSYVRLKLNDAIVPLRQLPPCEDRADGLCDLDHFYAAIGERNDKNWWARCQT